MKKLIINLGVLGIIAGSTNAIVYAYDTGKNSVLVENIDERLEQLDIFKGIPNMTRIDMKDIPNDVEPIIFDNEEEALSFIKEIEDNIICGMKNNVNTVYIKDSDVVSNKRIENIRNIDSKRFGLGSIILNSNVCVESNKIVFLDPYATFEGFTYGYKWYEDRIGGRISSDGRSADVYCNGTVGYYILISGTNITEFYRAPVSLSGRIGF